MAVLQYNYIYSFQSTNKKLKKIPTWWLFHHHGQNFTFITGSLHSWVRLKQQRIQKKFESERYFELHTTLIVNCHIRGLVYICIKGYWQKLQLHIHVQTRPGICLPCHEVRAVSGAVCSQVLSSLPKASTPRLVNKQNSPYWNPNFSNPQLFLNQVCDLHITKYGN